MSGIEKCSFCENIYLCLSLDYKSTNCDVYSILDWMCFNKIIYSVFLRLTVVDPFFIEYVSIISNRKYYIAYNFESKEVIDDNVE